MTDRERVILYCSLATCAICAGLLGWRLGIAWAAVVLPLLASCLCAGACIGAVAERERSGRWRF